MAATIKLMRTGKKGYASYRVVVMDKKKKRNGSYIEKIGSYDPHGDPPKIDINKERMDYWRSRGAMLSEGIAKLLKRI